MAYLRANELKLAIDTFEESIRLYPPDTINAGMNYYGLAIAHHQLGQNQEATQNLARARELFQLSGPLQSGQQARIGPPGEWVAINLLSREAEALLRPVEGERLSY
jgi:hypothetical protein